MIEPDIAFLNAAIIFTGTVQKVTYLTHPAVQNGTQVLAFEGSITSFRITEYFKGTGGPELEIRGGNTNCDFGFETGKQYLVYASQNSTTGALGAFSCSRTALLDEHAKPDLSYLRRAQRGERPTMLYGLSLRSAWNYPKRGLSVPLADLTVTVEGQGKQLDLRTDQSGYFETFDLAPGSYRVHTSVTGRLRGAEEKTIELASGGVSSIIFRTTSMGSLRGRIVDPEGTPIPELHVELQAPSSIPGAKTVGDYTVSEQDGSFSFAELPPGRYIVAVNSTGRPSLYGAPFMPSYFPKAASAADARVVEVWDGVSVQLGDFVLQPKYPTVPVSGVVVTSDGKAVADAFVNLEKVGRPRDAAHPVHTDAAGHFEHRAFEGVTYSLYATADSLNGGILQSDRVEVAAAKNTAQVRLVVRPSR
jgi:hypothetical protein